MLARKALAGTAGAPKVYVEDVFSTYLYTGTGSNQTITNGIDLSGEGGMVWIKDRSDVLDNGLFDTVRGAGYRVVSNSTAAENYFATYLSSFNSDGFSVGTSGLVNSLTDKFASWTFRKAKKFFDVVTYTGNGTAGRTVSHNLGSVPGVIIVKCTSAVDNWTVYHRSLGGTKFLELNATGAAGTSASRWNDTDPTSTVFTVGSDGAVNGNGSSYVAYLFAHDAGGFGDAGSDSIIKCGSFATNSSGNATVDLGWEPQWLLIKTTGVSDDWWLVDNMRGFLASGDSEVARANASTETIGQALQINTNSTGFSVSSLGDTLTRIYIAIRRGPMKTPTSGTSVFSPTTASAEPSSSILQTGGSFPSDMVLHRPRVTSTYGFHNVARLTSPSSANVLITSSTGAESQPSANYWKFDSNTGAYIPASGYFNNNGEGNIAYALYSFRRAPGFFDVVCTTGNGSGDLSFTHNLGVAPDLMIIKSRTGTFNWYIYCSQLSQPTKTYGTFTTDALTASSNTYFTVSSTTVTTSAGGWVANNGTGVVYLFATLAGVSKVGTYTGNGSSQTINCNFTNGARFILIKRTDSTGDWYVYDSARGIVSGNDPQLKLNSTAAEATGYDAIDPDNSGFIVNNDATNFPINVNNATYIYLAIA